MEGTEYSSRRETRGMVLKGTGNDRKGVRVSGDDIGDSQSINPLKEYLPSNESLAQLPERTSGPLNRSQSAMHAPPASSKPRTLRPISKRDQRKKSCDDLDIKERMVEAKESAQQKKRHSLQVGGLEKRASLHTAISNLKNAGSVDISAVVGSGDELFPDKVAGIDFKKGDLHRQDGAAPYALLSEFKLDPAHVKEILRLWARGDTNFNNKVPKCRLLPDAKTIVWKQEMHRLQHENSAAVYMQSAWRKYIRRKKFLIYTINKMLKKQRQMMKIVAVWLRVAQQREREHPPGSSVRGLMSYWLIRLRVTVRQRQIARDKARDLIDMWGVVWAKRVLRCWAVVARISGMDRHRRIWRGNFIHTQFC